MRGKLRERYSRHWNSNRAIGSELTFQKDFPCRYLICQHVVVHSEYFLQANSAQYAEFVAGVWGHSPWALAAGYGAAPGFFSKIDPKNASSESIRNIFNR